MSTSRPLEGSSISITAAQRQHWGRCRPSQVYETKVNSNEWTQVEALLLNSCQTDTYDVQVPLGMSCKRQRRQARGRMEVQALHIDRRQHLEQAWRRQEVGSSHQLSGKCM